MNFYLNAFCTFFKIGLFTIGGGYAMVPLIEEEVVNRKKWLSQEDFIDLLAVSQSVPGVFAVNFSIFIGYKLKRFPGAEGTTKRRLASAAIISLTFLNCSASARELPPNFTTLISAILNLYLNHIYFSQYCTSKDAVLLQSWHFTSINII